MASVTLEHIYKRYGEVEVVTDLNLAIEPGEFVVLVGPSGCGKTTTLRMIAGLEEISAGTMRIGDTVVNGIAPAERDIAMVFQSYALYPHMSVFENMAFGLRLRKEPSQDIERRVREAAKILGIEDYLQRRPKALSGGQRQRVALGRAIVRNPKVFLFDEPLSNLDAKLRVQTRRELSALQQRLGTTAVYVTHDQVEAMTMGTRIAVMSEGVLRQFGSPEEVYNRPADRFTATFIGSPAMNILDGEVTNDKQVVFHSGDVALPLLVDLRSGPVALGVRPEDLEVSGEGFPAKVAFAESLGAENILYVDIGGQEILVRAHSDVPFEVGGTLHLRPRPDRLHFFESASGDRLNVGVPA